MKRLRRQVLSLRAFLVQKYKYGQEEAEGAAASTAGREVEARAKEADMSNVCLLSLLALLVQKYKY